MRALRKRAIASARRAPPAAQHAKMAARTDTASGCGAPRSAFSIRDSSASAAAASGGAVRSQADMAALKAAVERRGGAPGAEGEAACGGWVGGWSQAQWVGRAKKRGVKNPPQQSWMTKRGQHGRNRLASQQQRQRSRHSTERETQAAPSDGCKLRYPRVHEPGKSEPIKSNQIKRGARAKPAHHLLQQRNCPPGLPRGRQRRDHRRHAHRVGRRALTALPLFSTRSSVPPHVGEQGQSLLPPPGSLENRQRCVVRDHVGQAQGAGALQEADGLGRWGWVGGG